MLRYRSLTLALAATSLVLVPAAAHAASPKASATTKAAKTKKKSSKVVYPVVSGLSPRKLNVGQKLRIRGAHFRPGAGKTTVVFLRKNAPSVFVKADSATTTSLVVTIPAKFQDYLDLGGDGHPVSTLFHLRILASKFSKDDTKNSRSPIVFPIGTSPNGVPGGPGTTAPPASFSCQQAAAADPTGDADKDGLANGLELGYRLDPCNADTDGDTATDGYEYRSAIDLNGSAYPYPGDRPWPNPLDPSDIGNDFDGDGLMLGQEFNLWRASGAAFPLTAYSDGTQNTGGTVPVTTTAQSYLDLDGDHNLTDDERDFDGDGLSNMVELNYTGTQSWWKGIAWTYQPHGTSTAYVEPWYSIRQFSDLDATKADTDGDGVVDGVDDQDNDAWSNFVEMQLGRGRTGYRVHPFNPCLPDPHAATCARWIRMGTTAWPPFDTVADGVTSQMPGDAMPFGWHNVVYSAWDHLTPTSTFFTAAWDYTSGPQGS